MSKQLSVAWFSALDGGSVSNYATQTLLEYLPDSIEVTLFHNGEEREIKTLKRTFQAYHYLNAVRLDSRRPFDVYFYQLEDRKDCNFMRIHLALKPGIVWFHDFYLSNHGPEPILNSSWRDTVARFQNQKHPWPDHAKEHQVADVFAERESAMCFLPLFSNPRDHAEYKRLVKRKLTASNDRSFLLRHPVAKELFSSNRQRTVETPFVIALSALPRVESQVHHLFEALHIISFSGQIIWPLPESEIVTAKQILEEFDLLDRCQIVCAEGPLAWQQVVVQADLAFHLTFSAFGQPSPYLPMSLAAGVPACVTDFASGANYPDSHVFKVSPGADQAHQIAALIKEISLAKPGVFKERLSLYAQEFYDSQTIALQLEQILHAESSRIQHYTKLWRDLERDARNELMRESSELSVAHDQFQPPVIRDLLAPVFAELGWDRESL